jgi:predicted ATP-grasp superfamily ATP-dependent carboligase
MTRMGTPRRTVFIHEFATGGGLAGAELPQSWAAEGRAMRDALAEDFAGLDGVRVITTRDERFPANPRQPWTTVAVGLGQELDTFARLASEADYTALIAPESGGILLERTRVLDDMGAQSLGSTAEAVALTGSKLRLARHWNANGVATPPTFLVCLNEASRPDSHDVGEPLSMSELEPSIRYPCVVKPVDGAGALDTFVLQSPFSQPPPGSSECGPMVVQPFVTGRPMSASFIVDAFGRVHLIGIGRQTITIRRRRVSYSGGTVPVTPQPAVEPLVRAVKAVAGLRGWVGIDFLWDEAPEQLTMLEINPRLTTSYVGLRRLLPAGRLAQALLDAQETGEHGALTELAAAVAAQSPISFAPDGSVEVEEAVA